MAEYEYSRPEPPWKKVLSMQSRRVPLILLAVAGVLALIILGAGYYWFVQRVEVGPGEVLVLTRKVGKSLPDSAGTEVVLYPALLKSLGEPSDSTRFKGILFEPLPEGRYFFDPIFWKRELFPAQIIAKADGNALDEIGVLIRKFGNPLPPGKIVATEPDERGPLAEVLKPQRYNINPYAFELKRVKPVYIAEGFVGIQTLYAGADPDDSNVFVVQPGERGVQPDVLPPGMYYNNPYVRRIDVIETRTQSLDLLADQAISFPSNDSFEIRVEATIQYAIRQDRAPYVLTAIGEHADIAEKLILPYFRSLSRIEGSKLLAHDFISGEQRSAWQENVFQAVSSACYEQGIEIQQVLIRRIEPPPQIARPISERQLAGQQVNRYRKEIDLAKSQAEYVRQEEMQKQNRAIGEANLAVVTVTKESMQDQTVAITEAQKRFEVAKLKLEAARQQAAAIIARGKATAEVTRLKYEAEAKPLKEAISSFGGGEAYAQFFFYQKLGPALKSILASTDGPFADIFRALSKEIRNDIPTFTKPASPTRAVTAPTEAVGG
ncbi:MAG: SPFH domain-containing protein [Phycisphaerae bacterium]